MDMQKSFDCIVLGAGIVGIATALHIQDKGRSVLLLDKSEAGAATSYGNAGIIES
ncbi:MAG: FAD-dependent oxidoreductase, partial [Hyphomicrobiales bacterium]|nr:FAD-dependent oxidoreductase [Hyphomicrobiales bacterium]